MWDWHTTSVPSRDTKVSIGYYFATSVLSDAAGKMDTKWKFLDTIGYVLVTATFYFMNGCQKRNYSI